MMHHALKQIITEIETDSIRNTRIKKLTVQMFTMEVSSMCICFVITVVMYSIWVNANSDRLDDLVFCLISI